MKKINQYVSIVDEKNIIIHGKYEIGKDLPSGEYYMWGKEINYSYIRETWKYNFDKIGDCYAVFKKGDKLRFEAGKMTPIENIVYIKKDTLNVLVPGHVYRIEKEIPIGYYVYKFDDRYFKDEGVFLKKNQCGIDIYEAHSDSRFYREQGEFGNVKITDTQRHVVIKNGCAKYYGNDKFDAVSIIDEEIIPFNEFWKRGKTIFSNEIIDLKVFLKHNKGSRFCGKVTMNLFYYYWYCLNGVCIWFGKIRPYYSCNLQTIKMDFYAEGCNVFHKTFEGFQGIRYQYDKKHRESYIITTSLPKEFYGKKITIVLKAINEINVEETLEDFKDIANYLDSAEIRQYYEKDFTVLEYLLNEIGGLNVESELKYFEEVPDLIDKLIPVIEDVLKARADFLNIEHKRSEIKFKVEATYNKAFYCIAKLADEAKEVRSLNNGTIFEIVFGSEQLREIELTNYILYNGTLEKDEYIEEFLLNRSCRYYTINRLQQCMSEMNDKYGYSSKVTNSVLIRIIKNENKKMQREIDKIYSDIVKENRVPTRWGNEYRLFSLISSYNADAVYQYHCDWLGQQSLDIYITAVKIGVEYQGEQHYKAIDIWGGEESLEANRERDSRKKELCRRNGVKLLEWSYQRPVNEDNVISFMKENNIPFKEGPIEAKGKESIMAPVIKPKSKKISKEKKVRISKYVIVQYNTMGKYIEKFSSIGNAAEQIGISATSISKVLRGERNSAAGYIWKKFDMGVEIPISIDVNFDISKINLGTARKVGLLGRDGRVEREFNSISDAAHIMGISTHHIQNELTKKISKEWKYI